MIIAIVSLDNSEKIQVGGKHVHQELLRKGLADSGHTVFRVFPHRSFLYLVLRVYFAFLSKIGVICRGKIFGWCLHYLAKSLEKGVLGLNNDVDVIFAQDPVSAVAVRNAIQARKLQTKIVMTLHGYLSLESINYGNFSSEEEIIVLEAAKKFEREALDCIDSLIAVDSRISEYIKIEFDYKKEITILKNAINPELFNTQNFDQLSQMKNKIGIPLDRKLVLIPRRLVRKNGVDVAIRALSTLKKKSIPVTFLIMGDGPEMKRLKQDQEAFQLSSKDIVFLGSISHHEAVKYYDLSDIILVPSVKVDGIEEATSLSMLEGMAAKKIVVVSNIGGMKEVIRHLENGFLAPQGDPSALASLIVDILNMSSFEIDAICSVAYNDVCSKHHYALHAQEYLKQVQ